MVYPVPEFSPRSHWGGPYDESLGKGGADKPPLKRVPKWKNGVWQGTPAPKRSGPEATQEPQANSSPKHEEAPGSPAQVGGDKTVNHTYNYRFADTHYGRPFTSSRASVSYRAPSYSEYMREQRGRMYAHAYGTGRARSRHGRMRNRSMRRYYQAYDRARRLRY